MRTATDVLKKTKERLLQRIEKIDSQIKRIEDGDNDDVIFINPDRCQYMSIHSDCTRAKSKSIHKIECSHPKVDKDFANVRTDEKCSIPLDTPKEEGMQFCKYYKHIEIGETK